MTHCICAVIPTYNHDRELGHVIDMVCQSKLPVIVVDDGSRADIAASIAAICAAGVDVELIRRNRNGGKGAAVIDGIMRAGKRKFSHALQVDADGQHDLSVIEKMVSLCNENPDALILAQPRFDRSIPTYRRIGRWITHIWVSINTLSLRVIDSMCGLRIYPVDHALDIIRNEKVGRAMDFDSEIFVRLYWRRVRPVCIPVNVCYPEGNRSNFRIWHDNMAISMMHARLFVGMLRRLPKLMRQ